MPNMLQYRSEETGETVTFAQIDDELCAHLGVKVDPNSFVYSWYDTIGLLHSCGKGQTEILDIWTPTGDETPNSLEGYAALRSITNYIHCYYTPISWYSRAK